MTSTRTTSRVLLAAVATLALGVSSCGSDSDSSSTSSPSATAIVDDSSAATVPATDAPTTTVDVFAGELAGVLGLDPGTCDGSAASGSFFRMMQPDGNFIPNADSACADTTYSLLTPGTDGGLVLGDSQAAPNPAFDATGNGLADMIAMPVKFFGVSFAVATDSAAAAPTITALDGVLTGDLSAFTAYYGAGVFNQGSPKPDGAEANLTGTIDPATGLYVIEWTSLISGGSFDGFTGVWHLEGTFTPAG